MTVTDPLTTEIEKHVSQLREEGWCLIEDVIPADNVDAIRQTVEICHQQAKREYETLGGSITGQENKDGTRGKNLISYLPSLAPYLADKRVLGVVKAVLDPHVRIAQTEIKTIFPPHMVPHSRDEPERFYHSDWPHDLRNREKSGRIRQPFPDVVMGLTALWMLSPFTRENGATWVVPGSHRDTRNPQGKYEDDVIQFKPIEGEMQVTGRAGSVLVIDSRIWHTGATNLTDKPRVAVLVRYAPWWLNVEFGGRNQALVPVEVYEALTEDVKALYRHRVKGVANRL